jgi:hypothetical protein
VQHLKWKKSAINNKEICSELNWKLTPFAALSKALQRFSLFGHISSIKMMILEKGHEGMI